jgi:FHS family L-fucose permease-like MFS transporter
MFSSLCALLVILGSGKVAVLSLVLVSVFMSLMFPTIYGIALGSLTTNGSPTGKETSLGDVKIGASGLIMAILGGALLTPLQGMVSDAGGVNLSYIVPLGCFLVVLFYSIYVISNEKILSDTHTCQ